MLFRPLLSLVITAAIAVSMPMIASASDLNCNNLGNTSSLTCSDVNGNLVVSPGNSTNTLTDANDPASGVVLGDTTMIGANNLFTGANSGNSVIGNSNQLQGTLGSLMLQGNFNTVDSNEANISILGNGNNVQGGDGYNFGIKVIGDTDTVTDSSGTVVGIVNSVSDSSLANVHGNFNTVTDSQDVVVDGDGNTVSGVGTQVLGSGNTAKGDNISIVGTGSTAFANGATVIGSDAHAGAGAADSVVLGSGSSTNRSRVVEVGGRQITGVADGVEATDASNVRQVETAKQEAIEAATSYADAGDVRTLHSAENYADQGDARVQNWAKSYTDEQAAKTLRDANVYTDMRFRQLDERFARAEAMSSAQTSMAANFRGANSVSAGVGFSGGHNAIAIGYRHVTKSGHVSFSAHGAIAGSERSIGVGVGYSW